MNHLNRLFAIVGLITALGACASATDTLEGVVLEPVDLIVYGDYVLTMRPGEESLRDYGVAIKDGKIIAVQSHEQIAQRFRATQTIEGTNRVVMPGLVNGHTHAAMALLRGVADDLELMEWLTGYIFPAEVQLVDENFVRVGTRLACWEMIESGTTSFVDMYYFPDAVAETVMDCGLRAVVAPSVIEQKAPDAETGEQSLAQAIDFIQRWQGRTTRVVPALGAHSVYTISESGLKKISDAASDAGAPIAIHVSESLSEIAQTRDNYHMTPVALLKRLGMLDQPMVAAHMVHPSDDDIAMLAQHSTGVIHNPTSNMKLASGVSPVARMLAQGVTVGIGTDGAASNNDLDLWEEIRLASLLAKVDGMSPTALPAASVLAMATRDGAVAAGLGDIVGTLTPGLEADLIQLDLSQIRHAPRYDIVSHLVYVADSQDVVTTIVAGQVLMLDRKILSIDAGELALEVDQWRDRIAHSLSLEP